MNCARNYENVLNFVKGMPKILLVPTSAIPNADALQSYRSL